MKQQGAWRGATVLAVGVLALIATATSLSAQATPPPVWLIAIR